jgi:hypothetical protein
MVEKLLREMASGTPLAPPERQYLRLIGGNYVSYAEAVEEDTLARPPRGLTDEKISEWNLTVDRANRLTEQISLVHKMMTDDDQRPSRYEPAYKTLWSQYKDAIESLRKLDSEAVNRFKVKVVARVKELEARIEDLSDNWDPVYFDYFERTLACYEKNYDLMVTLDECSTLSSASRETARRTEELLATRGWCLWKCSVMNDEVIVVVRDEQVTGYPQGYVVYTEGELKELFKNDVSDSSLALVYETKKVAGAVVTGVEEAKPMPRHHSKAQPVRRCQCGSTDFWQRTASQWEPAEWLCNRCHPRPGAIVKTTMHTPNPLIRKTFGMTADQVLEIWQRSGRTAIPLRQGETCADLEKFLMHRDIRESDLEAVRLWLEKQEEGGD